jgi:UDP:flavonoid glycosyltransferase YjiC (YdhE family)
MLTLDAAGNWPPEAALVRALVERGHQVHVLSHAAHVDGVRSAGASFRPYADPALRDALPVRRDETPDAERARVLREVYLNPGFAEVLLAEVARERPDVLLVDQMLPLAAAAAESTGLPTAILWHTVFGAVPRARGPVRDFLLAQIDRFRAGLGLGGASDPFLPGRADAILVFTYEAFDEAPADRPPGLHYVGPLLAAVPAAPDVSLPWPPDDPRPLVVVSYSTGFQNQAALLQRVLDATAELPMRVLLTLGKAVAADEVELPANAAAVAFVPHAAVLPHARLVVTHAGHGTVMAAATAGVPLLCTPMGRDQHAVASCVAARGLGIVLPSFAGVEELRAAIAAALRDDGLRERSRAFATAVDPAAGRSRAIEVLEGLGAGARTPAPSGDPT